LFRTAKEQVMRSGNFAFAGRKQKHRKSRELSIIRLNAAVRENGISYSSFINRLKEEKIDLNRSTLVKIASNYYQSFLKIINIVKNK
jgi:large subunit ribosomal protein L20